MSDYYRWTQYYDPDTLKQTSSDEILYFKGHQHGRQPTQENWYDCQDDLLDKVNTLRQEAGFADLTLDDIAGAEKKTRSAH